MFIALDGFLVSSAFIYWLHCMSAQALTKASIVIRIWLPYLGMIKVQSAVPWLVYGVWNLYVLVFFWALPSGSTYTLGRTNLIHHDKPWYNYRAYNTWLVMVYGICWLAIHTLNIIIIIIHYLQCFDTDNKVHHHTLNPDSSLGHIVSSITTIFMQLHRDDSTLHFLENGHVTAVWDSDW